MYPGVGQPPDGERDLAGESVAQKLRELPSELAPPFGWDELQRRSRMRAKRGRRPGGASRSAADVRRGGVNRRALALAACAASLAVAAAITSRFNRSGPEPARAPVRADTAQLARPVARTDAAQLAQPAARTDETPLGAPAAQVDTAQTAPPGERAVAPPEPEALLARADAAERWLASEPDGGPIVRVSTHLAVTHLEDRIASMDDLLNLERLQHARAPRLRALQLERAQLVDSLAQVRYAEILADEAP